MEASVGFGNFSFLATVVVVVLVSSMKFLQVSRFFCRNQPFSFVLLTGHKQFSGGKTKQAFLAMPATK